MTALWAMGEGTVRDIHRQLCMVRPRAYTSVLTIMDRLSHKAIVTRRKVGLAYRYQANLSADEARLKAVEKIVAGFFNGSPEALAAHLAARREGLRISSPPARIPVDSAGIVDGESIPQKQDKTLP